jgi:hypothetical protein
MSNIRMDKLYTAKEAREKLGGLAPTSFKRLVDSGKIKKVVPPNKKNGFYIKEDVDKLAAIMNEFVEIYSSNNNRGYEFVQASSRDEIEETVQIAKQRFGERTTDVETRIERFNTSPRGDYVLKHNGVIVGFFSMQAIKKQAIEDIFIRKTGRWLSVNDIEIIAPGKPLEIIVSNIASRVGVEKSLETEYGRALVLEVMQLFINLGREGIDISKIWAMSSTVYGIKLCRDIMKFQELGYINSEQIGFMMDVETSESLIAKQYLEAFKEAERSEDKV